MNAASPVMPALEPSIAFITKPTPQLRSAIAHLRATLPASDFLEFLSVVQSAFEKYQAKLLEFKPGVDRGVALHQMMERELKSVSQIPISCRRGCTGCCHYEVEITQNEAAILREIVLSGMAIDRKRLALQASRERKSTEWRRFGSRDNRCVFLSEDGACGIYEDRPSICRKHVVTTPATACATEGASVAPVQVLLAEILLSAELSIDGTTCGSLAQMLSQSLHEAEVHPNLAQSAHGKISILSVATKSSV